jgi:hypothetical protein
MGFLRFMRFGHPSGVAPTPAGMRKYCGVNSARRYRVRQVKYSCSSASEPDGRSPPTNAERARRLDVGFGAEAIIG